MVERAAVASVLKEQELAAAFGPQGVATRVRLGKVLTADVLVLVRPLAGGTEPALGTVVCETAGGLRLWTGAAPVTADPASDSAALLAAVRAGLTEHAESVRTVVAVPPFVSHDLTFENDDLKGALARLVEREAMARPGVVAVELAEAEAVAAELRLSAPGAAVARPLPLYLLGEYRHDGVGAGHGVTLTLRIERAGKPVGNPSTSTVPPAPLASAVRAWAAGAVPASDGVARPPADPAAEADQLAARGREFARLANWAEASALLEAALLVQPDRDDIRVRLCSASTRCKSSGSGRHNGH